MLVMDKRRVCVRITREALSAARRMRIVRLGVKVNVMVSSIVSTQESQASCRVFDARKPLIAWDSANPSRPDRRNPVHTVKFPTPLTMARFHSRWRG